MENSEAYELWEVEGYYPQYGERTRFTIKAPIGTHAFQIPRLVCKLEGIYTICTSWKKIKEVTNDNR